MNWRKQDRAWISHCGDFRIAVFTLIRNGEKSEKYRLFERGSKDRLIFTNLEKAKEAADQIKHNRAIESPADYEK